MRILLLSFHALISIVSSFVVSFYLDQHVLLPDFGARKQGGERTFERSTGPKSHDAARFESYQHRRRLRAKNSTYETADAAVEKRNEACT